MFAKDRFVIDLERETATCSASVTVRIGRKTRVGVHETAITRARREQTDPSWRPDHQATRPKVERKLPT